jgi:hypothetical protein
MTAANPSGKGRLSSCFGVLPGWERQKAILSLPPHVPSCEWLLTPKLKWWVGKKVAKRKQNKTKQKKKKKTTAHSIPLWSPTIVLTMPSTV